MASLLSPRRTDPEIVLHTTVAQADRTARDDGETELPRVSWLVAALGGAWAAVLSGWVLVAGVTVLGWLTGDTGTFAGALGVGTRLWLLAHAADARLGSSTLTLVPWGATLGFAFVLSRLAAFAAVRWRGRPRTGAVAVTATMTLAYVVAVAAVALLTDGPAPTPAGPLAVLIALLLATWWGACRGQSYHPTQSWPSWCRAVPRAVAAGQLVMLVAGTTALVAGLLVHLDRVVTLTEGLHTGVVGGLALWLVQLAYLPNAVVWAASYTLGAGFTLGPGSVVSPAAVEHGLLPSIPLLGALPGGSGGNDGQLWWLAAGVVAGGVAAWVVTRARPAARCDETSIVGALAGVLAGGVFVALAWVSGGDLGVARLSGLGPRLLPLLVLSTTTMGLAGMLAGLLLGLVRRARP